MDWFKRATGIKIVAAIWLLVLLVPIWQLRARRQLQSDQLLTDPSLGLGLTKKLAEQAAKQFPDEAGAQEAELSVTEFDGFTNHLKQIEATDAYFKRYADLSRKFPDSNYVRSQWLRAMTRGSLPIESAAQTKSYGYLGYPMGPAPKWVSTENLEAAINCAREGAKREPNNAFWPWMEAMFQFSLRRDGAAIETLKKAGNCTEFDDGILETVRQRITLNKRLRLSDWEDDAYEQWAILLPHLSRLRSAARATMWQAQLAYKSGDKVRALQIAVILQRAAVPIARSQDLVITGLVGRAMCYVAWQETLKLAKIDITPYTEEKEEVARRRAIVTHFAEYARQLGYPQIGDNALEVQPTLDSRELGIASVQPDFDGVMQKAKPIAQFHWVLSWLIKMTICGAFIWLLTYLTTYKNPLEAMRIRRSMLIWAAFCIGATGVILFVAMQTSVKDLYDTSLFTGSEPEKDESSFDIQRYLPFVLLMVWFVPVVLSVLTANVRLKWQMRIKLTNQGVDWLALTRFLIFISLFVGVTTTFITISEPTTTTIWGQFWPAQLFVTLASLAALFVYYLWTTTGTTRLAVWFVAGGVVLGLGALMLFPPEEEGGPFSPLGVAALSLIFLSIGAFLLKKRAEIIPIGIGRFIVDFALRFRVMAATVAVFGSVFYLLLTLVSSPMRRDVQRESDKQLQLGEVATIRMKLSSKNNTSN